MDRIFLFFRLNLRLLVMMVTNTYHFVYKSVCEECGKMLEEESKMRARTEIKVNS